MKPWLVRWWRRLVVVLLLGAAAIGVAWWMSRPRVVEVVAVHRSEVVQTVVASGRVLPSARVALAALGLGRVVHVQPQQGERVEAGALLAQLDDTEARASVESADAAVAQARAHLSEVRGSSALVAAEELHRGETSLRDAEDQLARLTRLISAGGVTEQELVRARSQVELARSTRDGAQLALGAARGAQGRAAAAELARAEAEASAARARLTDRSVRAPAAGVVVTRSVEEGDVVTAGEHLFDLAMDGPIEVRIDPDESTLALLALGQPALVGPEAYPDHRIPALVSFIAPAVDPLRGTIEVHLAVPEPPNELIPDMTVSVDIEVARRASALVVSANALRGVGTTAPWALVVEGGLVVRRDVQLGAIGEDDIEILGGLREGERAIPTTEVGVEPGARVRVRVD